MMNARMMSLYELLDEIRGLETFLGLEPRELYGLSFDALRTMYTELVNARRAEKGTSV